MRYLFASAFISAVLLSACSTTDKSAATTDIIPAATTATMSITDTIVQTKTGADKTEILGLIQKMLKWSDSDEGHVDVLPAIVKDSVGVGFDMAKVDQTVTRIKETGMFADEFIVNYKKIIKTLDEKIKSGKYEKWLINELPPFTFANDADPWCSCQDNFPWDDVDIEVIKLTNTNGELKWGWGKPNANTDPKWKETASSFRVTKEDGKWKIAYLNGFDHKIGTQMLKAAN